jgi:hypothetical protein
MNESKSYINEINVDNNLLELINRSNNGWQLVVVVTIEYNNKVRGLYVIMSDCPPLITGNNQLDHLMDH